MKAVIALILLGLSMEAFALCESAKLNNSDTIFEEFYCIPTKIVGAKKIDDLCIVKAKTIEDDGEIFQYTHMQTKAVGESGWKNSFSTFKWHHKKNNSVSKMWETEKKIKMKDITATDFMRANVYKVSEFDKTTNTLEIEVYKKKAVIGLKKRKWYSADFNCKKTLLP